MKKVAGLVLAIMVLSFALPASAGNVIRLRNARDVNIDQRWSYTRTVNIDIRNDRNVDTRLDVRVNTGGNYVRAGRDVGNISIRSGRVVIIF